MSQAYAWAAFLTDEAGIREDGLARMNECADLLPWNSVYAIKRACLLSTCVVRPEDREAAMRAARSLEMYSHEGESRAYLALARGLVAALNNDSQLARRCHDEARRLGATSAPLRVLERRIPSG